MVTRLQYLERYLSRVDFVQSGRTGAISDDRRLVTDYRPEFFGVFEPYLRGNDPRVKAETVLLLSKLNERAAEPQVREMWHSEGDLVSSACLSYMDAIGESERLLESLFERIESSDPEGRIAAAGRLATHAGVGDIPRIRRAYGKSDGEAKKALARALARIASKSEETEGMLDLILSDPVLPDERRFMSFARGARRYLDVRYRENVFPERRIDAKTQNNVAEAINKIRERLYNEYDNLDSYSEAAEAEFYDLSDLLSWASEDLSSKIVYGLRDSDLERKAVCAACDHVLVTSPSGKKVCPGCGRS
ncbi:MAG: hypothetical protein GX224_05525 [Thermoplasmatales archaeon]|nr:hypothetical protein [Thermoplasmatales archaeon]